MNKQVLKDIVGENWFTIFEKTLTREIEFDIDGVRGQYGKTVVYPNPDKVWRCFQETKLENLKVIIVGQEPYSTSNVANGITFDCRDNELTPSMRCILDAYQDCYPNHFNTKLMNGNLQEWCDQGVLMLNSSLTVEVNKPGSHKHYWSKFISFLLYNISVYNKDIIIVSIGKDAENMVTGTLFNYKIKLEHPDHANRQNRKWKHNYFFWQVNSKLEELNKIKIDW